jgi:hypothetical protein
VPDKDDSARSRAWRIFDELVARAHRDAAGVSPWAEREGRVRYEPDLALLGRLLAVPVALDASTQSGVPAIALDVWVAYELRRAGFAADEVWPRASAPRVMPREISALLASLPAALREQVSARLVDGKKIAGIVGAEAKVLGKNYVKQVDVVISAWDTGPQAMISTKRMDAALGKNAANRVEESYGDAKNLRSRHPRSALGFVYSLRAQALDKEPDKAAWLVDLLEKLGQEDDAYDAVALLLPDLEFAPRQAVTMTTNPQEPDDDADDSPDGFADAGIVPVAVEAGTPAEVPQAEVEKIIASLPQVRLREDGVPPALVPGRFFEVIIGKILDSSPVNFHVEARRLRGPARRRG